MEFNIVKVSESQAAYLYPPKIRGIATEGQTFVAFDGEYVAALALVKPGIDFKDEYVLNYIAPGPGYGIKEVEALLEFVEKTCKSVGIDSLICSLSGSFEELIDIHKLLKNKKYVPIVLNGHRLIYRKEYLEQSDFFSQISKIEPLLKHVKSFNELDKKQLEKFYAAIKRSGRSAHFTKPDLEFGRFFVENNEITGMLNMQKISPRVLFASEIFTYATQNSKLALPAMLGSAMLASKKLMDDDTLMIFQVYSDNLYSSFKSIFGEADSEELIFEYIGFTNYQYTP